MLTDAAIRAAKTSSQTRMKLSDGGGLQLWVTANAHKSWHLLYYFDGKQARMALGAYPAVGLKDARTKRDDAKRLLASGVDPAQKKKLDKLAADASQAMTFGVVAGELLAKKEREGKTGATMTKAKWYRSLASDLADRPIAEIDAPEVLRVLQHVEMRGRHETATKLRAYIGSVFRFGMATGRCTVDPTQALAGALTVPKVTHRAALVDPVAFGGLLRAVDGYTGTPEVRLALQLLSLTFVRPGELRHAEWGEFDLAAGVWAIPAEKMKMRREHRIPLAPQAVAILQELHGLTGNGKLVFPSAWGGGRPMSENTLNAALRRLGFAKDEATSHGFRSTASSILNESGKWNSDAIEVQLAHQDANTVTRAYQRAQFWDERVKLMAWWADKLDTLRQEKKSSRLLACEFVLYLRRGSSWARWAQISQKPLQNQLIRSKSLIIT